jgi:hypothetical protein
MTPYAPQGAHPRNDNATRQGGVEGFTEQTNYKPNGSAPETKLVRILRLLYEGGAWTFQTIREHGDSCLHSTVSTLQNLHGIEVDREPFTVRGFGGRATRCKLYRLRRTPDNLKRARAVLGMPEQGEK